MLVVLDTLRPVERAVFVLREVFGYGYEEIAAAVERTPEAVRQIASRAKRHLAEHREPLRGQDTWSAEVIERFSRAARGDGELQELLDVISPDVVLHTDGGGVVKAALQPIHGVDKVLRFLTAVRPDDPSLTAQIEVVNGRPAVVVRQAGAVTTVVTPVLHDGQVTTIYIVRNPDKLTRFAQDPVRLTRG